MASGLPSEFLAPKGPRVFAHRGLSLEAPENTLLAFLKALSAGATHLETDVQVSRDGIAVLSHDPDLVRLVGRNVRVDQLTMAELGRIDLGAGQSFVSLGEALDAFPDARFNIDVKAAGAAAADGTRGAGCRRDTPGADRVVLRGSPPPHRGAAPRRGDVRLLPRAPEGATGVLARPHRAGPAGPARVRRGAGSGAVWAAFGWSRPALSG